MLRSLTIALLGSGCVFISEDEYAQRLHQSGAGSEDTPCVEASWWTDADGDGYGDPDGLIEACEQPSGTADNGDDCDGLDLIVYGLLLDFGFDPDRVYRTIVKRDRDRGNHMITLWFEDPHDPWVLDATGAMTFTMLRFSETEGWTPIKVFNERVQFRALPSEETLSLNEN